MQPHSMCAVALAKFYWNQPEPIVIKGDVTMRVEYRSGDGLYKFNEYRLSNIQESTDQRELKVYIIRSSGGISCEVTLRRNSLKPGAEVTLVHSQQHLSGLREVFTLYEKDIKGTHFNSQRYRGFQGGSNYHDRLALKCEVKEIKKDEEADKKIETFVERNYDLEIKSINYEKKAYAKPDNVIQFPGNAQSQKKAA